MGTRRREWAIRVRQWRRSGLTAREFADSLGINRNTLTYWAWRLEREPRTVAHEGRRGARRENAAAFVEVMTQGIADGCFELDLGGDRRLRIPPRFEPESLERLLALLESRR
jgi:transposase